MTPFERRRDRFTLSTDKARLDVTVIHAFLSNSYWARGISRATVEQAIAGALCFGLFAGDEQVGFARVITDRATFAYLSDVFILEGYRGNGLGKWLIESILAHPELQGLRRWLLATADAHGLYAQFGFAPLAHPEKYMTIHRPNSDQTAV
ncbi:MAG: GNAT family N-acetyltransferase [Anaerolineae bacterium]|nr:GNAT family N-acetyltransferase [Anaerolineae bacterium]